jgi:hypothetical protein
MVVSRGFLASAVARALGTFCELDESLVESRLLNKARITLKDLRLKPKVIRQTNDYTVELHGRIKSAVFKWRWAGSGLLKKCTFTLSGLRITLKPVSGSTQDSQQDVKEKSTESDEFEFENEEKKGSKNWKEKFVKNVLDQLTIKVEDIEIVAEAPRNPKEVNMPWKRQLVLSGKDIELESLGRVYPHKFLKGRALKRNKVTAPLLQDLRIGSLSARIVIVNKEGNAKVLPLIHPFQYYARVRRVHGARFGSFHTGLEVVGQEEMSPVSFSHLSFKQTGSVGAYESISTGGERVEVYADDREIETSLCNFQTMNETQSVSWDFSPQAGSFTESRDEMEVGENRKPLPTDELYMILGDEQLTSLFSVISMLTDPVDPETIEQPVNPRTKKNAYMRPGALGKLSKAAPMNFVRSSRSIVKASTFELPFPILHVELPNDVSLLAEDCCIKARTDDSLAKIFGTGAVSVDHTTLLEEGTTWSIDLIKKEISLEPKTETPTPQYSWAFNHEVNEDKSSLEVAFSQIKKLGTGIGEIIEKKINSQRTPSPVRPSAPTWSLKLKGTSCLQF